MDLPFPPPPNTWALGFLYPQLWTRGGEVGHPTWRSQGLGLRRWCLCRHLRHVGAELSRGLSNCLSSCWKGFCWEVSGQARPERQPHIQIPSPVQGIPPHHQPQPNLLTDTHFVSSSNWMVFLHSCPFMTVQRDHWGFSTGLTSSGRERILSLNQFPYFRSWYNYTPGGKKWK